MSNCSRNTVLACYCHIHYAYYVILCWIYSILFVRKFDGKESHWRLIWKILSRNSVESYLLFHPKIGYRQKLNRRIKQTFQTYKIEIFAKTIFATSTNYFHENVIVTILDFYISCYFRWITLDTQQNNMEYFHATWKIVIKWRGIFKPLPNI